MITSKFTILAKTASIDSLTNQLSISNVIDEVEAPEVPSSLVDVNLVTLFVRDKDKDESLVSAKIIISLNNKIIGEQLFNIDFQNFSKNRTVLYLPYLQLADFGILKFEYKVNEKVISSYDIKVVKLHSADSLIKQPTLRERLKKKPKTIKK